MQFYHTVQCHRCRKFWGSVQLACWLQECPSELLPWIECKIFYHKPSPRAFHRIWQYIQPASQPQTTCNHTSPEPPHSASSPPRLSETSHPDSCCNNRSLSVGHYELCHDDIGDLLGSPDHLWLKRKRPWNWLVDFTGIKGRQVHPLIRFLLRSRVDEKSADLHEAFHLCFVPGWRNGAISGVPLISDSPGHFK